MHWTGAAVRSRGQRAGGGEDPRCAWDGSARCRYSCSAMPWEADMTGLVESDLAVNRRHLPHRLDGGVAHRARIGLIVLASDHTIEHEWRRMLDRRRRRLPKPHPQLPHHHPRDAEGDGGGPDPGDRGDPARGRSRRGGVRLHVGRDGVGEDTVAARIRKARPGVAVTTPITAALAGMRALGVRRVALLTPISTASTG